ncbi:hypothetical protein BH11PSE11_BH11PSE11_11740 [soil metagenome]
MNSRLKVTVRASTWRVVLAWLPCLLSANGSAALPAPQTPVFPMRPAGTANDARRELLLRGEAALAGSNVDAATQAFEHAGAMMHAADAEMGLVRSYMQAGEYKRALSFSAHVAGEHRDEPGGVALYAWLLHIGGNRVAARRLLQEAEGRLPADPLLALMREELSSPFPMAASRLSQAPARFAPYGSSTGLPLDARVVGTGVLLSAESLVLVPLSTLSHTSALWVRNGLGKLARAKVERRLVKQGIAVLRLDHPMPTGSKMSPAARDPFPGSIAHSVEYATTSDAKPAWPVLTSGFLGQPKDDSGERRLGIDLQKGPRGGPVFDAAGRFIGIAMPGRDGLDQIVLASRLNLQAGESTTDSPGASANASAPSPVGLNQIYESAMAVSVQIIATRRGK